MGRFMSDPYQPRPPEKAPTNGLGIAGFVFSLIGFLGCGLLAPIGVVLSFIAIFREPRGFAIAGLVLGLLGSIELIVVLIIFGVLAVVAGAAFSSHGFAGLEATFEMIEIGDELRRYRQTSGAYPPSLDAVVSGFSQDERTDPWGMAYAYALTADGSGFTLKSLGKDGRPDTPDDIVLDQSWLTEP